MTAALRHPPVRDLCSPDYELSHHSHRETLPDYDLGLLLDDKAAAIVAANKIDHDRHDVPDDTQRIDWLAPLRWIKDRLDCSDDELLAYVLASPVIYAGIVWVIPLACAALAWIGGGL